ncbi:unnamed protein product [Chrysoparadoxa australica]
MSDAAANDKQGLGPVTPPEPLLFEYLDLPLPVTARGGVVELFLRSHDIEFKSKLYNLKSEWPKEKANMIASGKNPAGAVPLVCFGEKHLTQHIATIRYMARTFGLTSGDDYGDYVQDLVADEYQGWRNDWVKTHFGSDEEAKATFKADVVPKKLELFEALYAKYKINAESPYLSTSPSGLGLWGDLAVFSIIFDQIQTGYMSLDQLEVHPNLKALHDAASRVPQIAKMLQEAKAKGG